MVLVEWPIYPEGEVGSRLRERRNSIGEGRSISADPFFLRGLEQYSRNPREGEALSFESLSSERRPNS